MVLILVGMFGWAVYDLTDNEETDRSDFETINESEVETGQRENESEVSEQEQDKGNIGIQVGNEAPNFSLETLSGEKVQLADYRGERVMLNFWATWCPPCRAEMPDMQKFHEQTDIKILAVNLTESEAARQDVHDFVEEYGLTFPILMDENTNVATEYAIRPIPTTYMIDSNGIIQQKSFGPMNYEQMVQALNVME
ncbi:thiol:disulfide interchange protein tlpA [Paraliobacillus quinghaiensis]|uniref:Thiol:disulfide interchange protein tlpA n=1 Tax=Paraliobacillus quinghaiensis TaxID=470815 RepID=A0A917WNU0_9BACI|nr:redoxin domain-containing protein [Paraliobacillus quinghaiensis]GGM19395.1 thiol:disulfide interchange protein tlpA [Paraliobacillus quinghaiensis]